MRSIRLRGTAIGCLRVRIGVGTVGDRCRMLLIGGTWITFEAPRGKSREYRWRNEGKWMLSVVSTEKTRCRSEALG